MTTQETSGVNGAGVSETAGSAPEATQAAPRRATGLAESMSTFVLERWEAARSRAEREAGVLRQRMDTVEKQVRERLILMQELEQKADQTREQVRKRVEDVQGRVISALNVASQSQVKAIHRELDRLSQKLEEMAAGRKPAQPDAPQS
jgi:DNA anti-recombination protein RmuC